MITEPGQRIYAVERYSCKSSVFIALFNKFGNEGAFESLLSLIAHPETSLENLRDIVSFFVESQTVFHKQFVDSYYERFSDAVEAKLLSATTNQLRQIKLTRIEEIIRLVWERLLLRLQEWFDL